MKTTEREPHAPSAALPELNEFLRPFHVHFCRSEGRQSLERYLTGLLTEHPNKNCDTVAQVVPGSNKQRLHILLTGIAFDESDPNDQRVRTMLQLPRGRRRAGLRRHRLRQAGQLLRWHQKAILRHPGQDR
jgi:hypothetical protein